MKKFLTSLLLASALTASAGTPVFLTAGQSNTDGRIPNADLPSYITQESYTNCKWSYCNGTKDVTEGTFEKFFPRMSSADNNARWAYDAVTYYFLDKALDSDFYVVKQSYGGTSINPEITCSGRKDENNNLIGNGFHWSADPTWLADNTSVNKGGNSLLKAFEDNIDACLANITDPDVKAIIWHQGESDKNSKTYYEDLKAVVAHLRAHLVEKTNDQKYATLPFICGTIPHASSLWSQGVEDAFYKLAAEDANFYVISLADGVMLDDNKHFYAATAERFGKEVYNLMVTLGLVSGQYASLATGSDATVPAATFTLHTIGDSTVSDYDQTQDDQKGMYGWGQVVGDYLAAGLTAKNWADRGESAKSFYNGFWNKGVKENVHAGDYVLIQFGHNDQSSAVGVDVYKEYLGKYVDEIKAVGATPVIVTSICRKKFDKDGKITPLGMINGWDGTATDDHSADYPYHAIQFATEKNVAYIDLTTATKNFMEQLGPTKSSLLFPAGQQTHTNEAGARVNAVLALQLLKEKNILTDYIAPLPELLSLLPAVQAPATGDESIVSEATTWDFKSYEKDAEIASDIVNINGLYVRGGSGNQAVKAATLNDIIVAKFAGNDIESSVSPTLSAGATGPNRCIAVNASVPGTFKVTYQPTAATAGREAKLFFNGEKVASLQVAKENQELSYISLTEGTFYFGSEQGYYVISVEFTPTPAEEGGDSSEDEWNTSKVIIPESGFETFANLSGFNMSLPNGLKAYAVHYNAGRASNSGVQLVDMGNIIPDGQAAIIEGPAGVHTLSLDDTTTDGIYSGDNKLQAVKTTTAVAHEAGENFNYVLSSVVDGRPTFTKADGSAVPFKHAYLTLPYSADAITFADDPTDDPTGPTVVSETTTWTFSGFELNNQDGTTACHLINSLYNYNGLYVRATAEHTVQIRATSSSTKNPQFEGETALTVSQMLRLNSNTSFAPAATVNAYDETMANANDRSVGITTSVPGTFTILVNAANVSTADRYAKLYFNGEAVQTMLTTEMGNTVDNQVKANKITTFSYKAAAPGTILFASGVPTNVLAARFVPTADIQTGVDEVAVEAVADPYWYTLQGVRLEAPTAPGIYIHAGKKFIIR